MANKEKESDPRTSRFREVYFIKHPFSLQPSPGWPGGELVLTDSFGPEGLDAIKAQFGDRYNLDNFLLVDAWAASMPKTENIRAELFRTAARAFDGDNALTGERLGIQATNFAKGPAFALIKHACSGQRFFPPGSSANEKLDKLHRRKTAWVRGATRAAFWNTLPAYGTLVASEMLPQNLQPYAHVGIGMLGLGSVFREHNIAKSQLSAIQEFVNSRRDKEAFAVALTELDIAARLVQLKRSTTLERNRENVGVVRRMAETAAIENNRHMGHFIQDWTQNDVDVPVGDIQNYPRPKNMFELSAQLAAGAAILGDVTVIKNEITENLPNLPGLTGAIFDFPPDIAKSLLESIKAHPRRPLEVLMHISPTLAALMSAQAVRGDHKTTDDLIIDGTIGKVLGVRGIELLSAKGYVVESTATSQDSHIAQGRTRLLKAYEEHGESVFFGSTKNGLRVLLPPDIKTFLTAQLFLNFSPTITKKGDGMTQTTKGTDHIQKAVIKASKIFKSKTGIPAAFALPVLADLQTTKQYLSHVSVNVGMNEANLNKCTNAIKAIGAMQRNLITYALSEIIGTPEEYKQLLTNPDRIKMMSFLVRELYQVDDPDLRAHLNAKIQELIGSRMNRRGDTVSGLLRPSGIYYEGIQYTDAIVDAFNHTLETNGSLAPDTYVGALRDAVAISYSEVVHFLSIGSDNHKGGNLEEYLKWAKNYVRPYIIPHLTQVQQESFLTQLTTAIRHATSRLPDMGPHSHEDQSSIDNRYKAQGLIDIAIGMCGMSDTLPDLSEQCSLLTSEYEDLTVKLNNTLYKPNRTVALE